MSKKTANRNFLKPVQYVTQQSTRFNGSEGKKKSSSEPNELGYPVLLVSKTTHLRLKNQINVSHWLNLFLTSPPDK